MKQADIVLAVRQGRAQFNWHELAPGLEVFADALKIDGVRVTVTARTAQRVADLLGATLTTPALEDMLHQYAVHRIPAFTIPSGPNGSWEQTVWHSRKIDEALSAVHAESGELVATVGKSWVLVNELGQRPGKACNYGWHSPSAPYRPASGTDRVWQPIGFAHNAEHSDYSQTLRLARVRGSLLPTHDGSVLRVMRQPGVMFERDTDPALAAVSDSEDHT